MRKSFVLTVVISVSTVLSLLIALYIAPLRTGIKQYTDKAVETSLSKVGVSYSEIAKARRSTSAVQSAMQSFEIPMLYTTNTKKAVAPRTYNNLIGFNSTTYKVGSGYVAYKANASKVGFVSSTSTDPITINQAAEGLNAGQNQTNLGVLQQQKEVVTPNLRSNEYITTTTDMSGANSTTPMTARQGANGGPPPSESGGGDPPPPSLPVGDGSVVLLLFATAFIALKFKRTLA